jgi:hypothetical protein
LETSFALDDDYCEPREPCADLLCRCTHGGMRAAVLAAGDEALDFRKAPPEAIEASRIKGVGFRKTADALNAPPQSAQPQARKAHQGIHNARDREAYSRAIKRCARPDSA